MIALLLVLQAAAPPDFEAFARAQTAACAVEAGPSNPEQRAAAFLRADCVRERMEAELDRVLVPLREAEPRRFAALMKEQAAWNRFVEVGCSLVEEMEWIIPETGEVTFGTAIGYAQAGCQEQARIERAYFAVALGAGDAARVAARVRAVGQSGAETRQALAAWRTGVARWTTTTATTESELWHPLTRDDARRVRDSAAGVEHQADALAASLCRSWPALRDAFSGQAPCAQAAGSYLLQHLR
jgi:hypothetical protein